MDEYHSVCYEHNSFQFSPLAPPEERTEGGEWDTITANRIEGSHWNTCCFPLFVRPVWEMENHCWQREVFSLLWTPSLRFATATTDNNVISGLCSSGDAHVVGGALRQQWPGSEAGPFWVSGVQ